MYNFMNIKKKQNSKPKSLNSRDHSVSISVKGVEPFPYIFYRPALAHNNFSRRLGPDLVAHQSTVLTYLLHLSLKLDQ